MHQPPTPAALLDENLRLRAALANSKDPCIYCQLPAEEMAKCRAGFPGCSRMDDITGCPEFGAMMQLAQIKELVEFWFSPWGAAKGARWEELSGDRPFHADVMLDIIRKQL